MINIHASPPIATSTTTVVTTTTYHQYQIVDLAMHGFHSFETIVGHVHVHPQFLEHAHGQMDVDLVIFHQEYGQLLPTWIGVNRSGGVRAAGRGGGGVGVDVLVIIAAVVVVVMVIDRRSSRRGDGNGSSFPSSHGRIVRGDGTGGVKRSGLG